MITRKPSSTLGLLVRSKTFVVACLLSSAAMIAEPQVAQARGGMNGFMAGAMFGGAMRGMGPRSYRAPRTYGTRSGTSSRRHGRSRNSEKGIEAKGKDGGGEKVFGNTDVPAGGAATGAAAAGAAATGAAAASTSGSSAAASTSAGGSSESSSSSGRSSRSGRSGGAGLQTIKDGLE